MISTYIWQIFNVVLVIAIAVVLAVWLKKRKQK